MKTIRILLPLLLLLGGTAAEAKRPGPIVPVPFDEVTLTGGFWGKRMQTELDVTLPFSLVQAGPAIEQLRGGADFLEGRGRRPISDNGPLGSDLYKIMEGAAYSLMLRPDPALEARIDSLIDIVGRAQQKDGYLFVCHTCGCFDPFWVGDRPYSKVVYSHELYNAGHLYEAAAAYYRATGKRALLDIAVKNARHVNRVFFEGDPAYNDGKPVMQAPGHEEIELALCKLYRVTGDRLYLDMAKKFLDIRGVTYRPEGDGFMSPFYAQQHAPVAEQTEPAGHAVRAAYLYTAMAMVDALTGGRHYAEALDAIWNDLVSTRIYITGGLGALASIEGFGPAYELPNKTAYSETCAAVGNVFFNQGMFLGSGDARYLDVAEISLFNNALAGISLTGDRFFYVNPLEADGEYRFNHGLGGRAPWFGCACCPPNIARVLSSIASYACTESADTLYVHLYIGCVLEKEFAGGKVEIRMTSGFPWDGKVALEVRAQEETEFTIALRIPGWCDAYTINGEAGPMEGGDIRDGYLYVKRVWKDSDCLELEFPMEVRVMAADARVREDIGKVAVTRGPIVYCMEEADNGRNLHLYRLGTDPEPVAYRREIAGASVMGVTTRALRRKMLSGDKASCRNELYMEYKKPEYEETTVEWIPYYTWANRGEGEMQVFIRAE